MKVKICGLTHADDVRWAASQGADYLGFVLAPSRRQVSLLQLEQLIEGLSNAVAVMVDPRADEVEDAFQAGASLVQLHGQERPEFCARWSDRILKAVRVRGPADLAGLQTYAGCCRHLLLDSAVPGSGQSFDWSWLREVEVPYFLAGGMDADSLERAVQQCRPYGVDASSALESSPGRKDPSRVQALIQAARRYP